MKKIFLASFCLISIILFSQKTYHFDYYVGYSTELRRNSDKTTNEFYSFLNSKDHSYEAKIIKGKKTKSGVMVADYPNEMLYYFDLKNENFPLRNEDFIYVKSEKLNNVKKQFEDEFKKRFIKTTLLENDGIIYKYKIEESARENAKNYSTKALISFAKYKDDLAFVGLEKLFDFYGMGKKVSLPENIILTSGTIEFDDAKQNLELKVIEPLNITLNIE